MSKILLLTAMLLGAAQAQTSPPPSAPAQPAPAQPAPAQPAPVQPAPAQPAQTPPVTTQATPAQDPDTVVARVGGRALTLREFEAVYRQRVGQVLNNQGLPYTDEALSLFDRYRPDILAELVEGRQLAALAVRRGLQVDEDEVQAYLDDVRGDFDSDEELEAALAQSGYASFEAYIADVRERFLISAYLQDVRGRFNFSDNVLRGYYNANRSLFAREPQACVRHILVESEAQVREVRAALAARQFADVAGEFSQDPGSRGRGGDLGCFEPGVTVPEFDRASFQGPLNTLQEVQTQFGYHLLTVYERRGEGVRPFEEVREAVLRRFQEDAVNRYLDSQLARVQTEVFEDRIAVPGAEQGD